MNVTITPEQHLQGLAHNALAAELRKRNLWLKLSERDAVAAAVVAAVRADIAIAERDRIRRLADSEAHRLHGLGNNPAMYAAGALEDFSDLLGGDQP